MLMNKTILVVDDNNMIRKLFSETLRQVGVNVIEAASAHHAIDALADGTYIDAIITDNTMPGMRGLQLAEKLNGRYPLLLISSDDLTDTIRKLPYVTHFKRKPLMPSELLGCVKSLLSVSQ